MDDSLPPLLIYQLVYIVSYFNISWDIFQYNFNTLSKYRLLAYNISYLIDDESVKIDILVITVCNDQMSANKIVINSAAITKTLSVSQKHLLY